MLISIIIKNIIKSIVFFLSFRYQVYDADMMRYFWYGGQL